MMRRRHGPAATCELAVWTPRGAPPPPQHAPWVHTLLRRVLRTGARIDAAVRVAFARHGRWISLHQTRTLLICNLVIASLFYPALVMYLLMTSGTADATPAPECVERHVVHGPHACVSGAHTPHNIWEAFRASLADIAGTSPSFCRDDPAYPVHDLHMVWDETPSLQVVDRPTPPDAPRVHVAQLVVSTEAVRAGGGSPYGVLQTHTLLGAHRLQTALSAALTPHCVKDGDTCLVLSPLDFWPSAAAIAADAHPAKSITGSPVRAFAAPPVAPAHVNSSIPLLYSTTLASRWPYLPLFSRAEFLVLTYFLESMDGWSDAVASAVAAVGAAGGSVAAVSAPPVAPGRTLLRFWSAHRALQPTLNAGIVALGYFALILYIFRGLVQMRRLHSRFGIAFTGSAQLIIDMIMSLSLCALLGIQLNAVPWALLPFVIVVVGSESMLYMIRTITNTPLSLTVHTRIALGLSQLAEPITLTVLSDLVILALVCAAVRVPSVTQFCAFVMCTLVVDYFMQMTFFVTVLSIDMQRLELAEVLVQGQPADERPATRAHAPPPPPQKADAHLLAHGISVIWHTRSARSMSFVLLMAGLVACCMYYGSWPAVAAEPRVTGTYAHFWHALNPRGAPLVELVTQPWTLVSFSGLGAPLHAAAPVPAPWLELLFFYRRAAMLLLIFLFVACPIAASMLVLSLVLKYLRRDADRLDDAGSPDAALALVRPQRHMAMRVTVHTSALHRAPVTHVCAHPPVSVDAAGMLRLGSDDAPTLTALADVRQAHGLAPDGSRVSALDAAGALIALGHASGRASVYADMAPVLDMGGGAPVCHVALRHDGLLVMRTDGEAMCHPIPTARAGGVSWGTLDAPPPQPTRIASAAPGVWAHVALDAPALCMSSASQVRVFLSGGRSSEAAAPTTLRCAALVAVPETRTDAHDGTDDAFPAEHGPPPRVRSLRRSGGGGSHEWLVAGGDAHVYAYDLASTGPVASLALAHAEPVRRLHVIAVHAPLTVLAAHTADHVALIGLRSDTCTLVLLATIDNLRGCADVYAAGEHTFLVGMRRRAHGAAPPRWEAWRMRIPRFVPATLQPADAPPLECASVDLEALVHDGMLAAHGAADERLPPTQLPLLASRIDRMVRAGTADSWLVPLGGVLVSLSVTD